MFGAGYAASVAYAWCRYGHVQGTGSDAALDSFMPVYEAIERQHVHVNAPADVAFRTMCDLQMLRSGIVRAIFRAREIALRVKNADIGVDGRGLVQQARTWGWGLLHEEPGREVVFAAVTQPWLGEPVFRALAPAEFATFAEPGYAKIAWTLRADSLGATKAVVSTETRVATTDAISRARFRRYWAMVLPGIELIRWASLRQVKADAEHATVPEHNVSF